MRLGRSHIIPEVLIIVAILSFSSVGLWRIDSPGLYYDEVLEIPPAAKLFESCNVHASVYLQVGCIPIILQPPYLGALKATLFGGLFAVVEPTAASIRIPMVLVQFLSIVLLVVFWKDRMPRSFSLVLLLMLCSDAVSTFHARVDWGPYALANLFKVIAVSTIIGFIETRRIAYLILCAASMIFGIFDKLNFLWLVGALTIASILVYGKELKLAINQNAATQIVLLVSAALGGAVTIALAMASYKMHALGSLHLLDHSAHVYRLLAETVDGAATYEFVFGQPWPGLRLASLALLSSTLLGLGVVALTPIVWSRLGRSDPTAVSCAYAAFLSLVLLLLFLAMVLTKEVSGPHHLIVVSSLWQLQILLCVSAWLRLLHLSSVKFAEVLAACVIAIPIAFQNVFACWYYLGAIAQGRPRNDRFSLAIYSLARMIDGMPDLPVISVDWGLNNSLVALARRGTRARYYDLWPSFKDIGEGVQSPLIIRRIIGGHGNVIFVMHPRQLATFPSTNDGFEAAMRHDCTAQQDSIADGFGRIQYYVVRVPTYCLVDKASSVVRPANGSAELENPG